MPVREPEFQKLLQPLSSIGPLIPWFPLTPFDSIKLPHFTQAGLICLIRWIPALRMMSSARKMLKRGQPSNSREIAAKITNFCERNCCLSPFSATCPHVLRTQFQIAALESNMSNGVTGSLYVEPLRP
jgi:hypothetical protein